MRTGTRRRSITRASAGLLSVALLTAACGSSKSNSAGGHRTAEVGLITSATGVGAAGLSTFEKGVQARLSALNTAGGVDGTTVKWVVADDQSTAAGALTAAHQLVQSDRVTAVLSLSLYSFAIEPFLKQQGIPLIGAAIDSSEWTDPANSNAFAFTGRQSFSTEPSTSFYGDFLKSQGVTRLGVAAEEASPSSDGVAAVAIKSAEAAGISVAYEDVHVPIGSTNVGPIVLGMKQAHVDGVILPMTPATNFTIIAGLKQAGVPLKATVLATGYGGDLFAVPAVVQLAQGVDFGTIAVPLEDQTQATKTMASNLSSYSGVTGDPTFAEYMGYLAGVMYTAALTAAGGNPAAGKLLSALKGMKNYNAEGLFAAKFSPGDFTGIPGALGPGECFYMLKLTGNRFVPITGANPLCGKTIR
jgi:branched-chain amino acid transport system substrate-binding protein